MPSFHRRPQITVAVTFNELFYDFEINRIGENFVNHVIVIHFNCSTVSLYCPIMVLVDDSSNKCFLYYGWCKVDGGRLLLVLHQRLRFSVWPSASNTVRSLFVAFHFHFYPISIHTQQGHKWSKSEKWGRQFSFFRFSDTFRSFFGSTKFVYFGCKSFLEEEVHFRFSKITRLPKNSEMSDFSEPKMNFFLAIWLIFDFSRKNFCKNANRELCNNAVPAKMCLYLYPPSYTWKTTQRHFLFSLCCV